MYIGVKDKLMTGQPVIVAGSWGSELVRRGVQPDPDLWTSPANLEHPDIIGAITRDYALAGADVIIANTYSTGPLLMAALERSDEMRPLDAAAIRTAREALLAIPDCKAALAGSFNPRGALPAGNRLLATLSERELMRLFAQKADILAAAGCDMIYMERLGGIERCLLGVEAAVATGLPVWVELAVERGADGRLHGILPGHWPLDSMVDSLMSAGAQVCLVNHHDPVLMAEALQTLKFTWAGPQGISLQNGNLDMPRWSHGGASPEDFAADARHLRVQGARVFALNAGTGPEYVRALRETFHGHGAPGGEEG